MALPEALKSMNEEAIESWVIQHAPDADIPLDQWLSVLERLRAAGSDPTRAASCADILQDAFLHRRAEPESLAILEVRAGWYGKNPAFRDTAAKVLATLFDKNERARTLIKFAGFDKPLTATECLKRLQCLFNLKTGALCYEKTWGFGLINTMDEYAQFVLVDFESKKGHRMALGYAAETLKLLDAHHILARRHRDPEAFNAWLKAHPADAVKSVLQTFGTQSVQQLQDFMSERILPPNTWKSFWDAARKELKNDPRVNLPSKRTEPIQILEREKRVDLAWIETLRKERDFARLFLMLDEAETLPHDDGTDAPLKEAIENRLAFIIKGSDRSQWHKAAQALIIGHALGMAWTSLNPSETAARLLAPDAFMIALHGLPARLLPAFFKTLDALAAPMAATVVAARMGDMALSPLNDAIDYLIETERTPLVADALRAATLPEGGASPEMLHWLCKHPGFCVKHNVCTLHMLAMDSLSALEKSEAMKERLKGKHQLRTVFDQGDWLKIVMDSMDEQQRQDFSRRLKHSSIWSTLEQYKLVTRMGEYYANLEAHLKDAPTPVAATPRITSSRSYRERQAQLKKVTDIDIPQNSKDIGVARSYGDLRENFEYKSAKEMQGILMRRKSELEIQLNEVKATDFENYPHAVAGMATSVSFKRQDGKEETYHILGEWDSDEAQHIISSLSRLAKALTGKTAGQDVKIPTESGEVNAVITHVSGLSEAMKSWAKSYPSTPASQGG